MWFYRPSSIWFIIQANLIVTSTAVSTRKLGTSYQRLNSGLLTPRKDNVNHLYYQEFRGKSECEQSNAEIITEGNYMVDYKTARKINHLNTLMGNISKGLHFVEVYDERGRHLKIRNIG